MPRISTTSRRASLVAVLATALVLSVTTLTAASPATAKSGTPLAAATGTARHAAAKAAFDRVVAAFRPTSAARSGRPGTTDLPDLTLLLRDLHQALPALTPAERRAAAPYLARPTDAGGDDVGLAQPVTLGGTLKTFGTDHFLIHYQSSPPFLGINQVSSLAQVQETADVLEHVYQVETGTMGYRKPLQDTATASAGNPNNPDGRIDVYLADLGRKVNGRYQGLYGYVSYDQDGATAAPYMVLDNDFAAAQYNGAPPANSLRVTAAHEFFHAVQYAYDVHDSTWFLEGTAVWMEDQVYPTINDYLQYLTLSQLARPRQSTDYAGGLEKYGTVVFWKYLSERFKDPAIIRQIWTRAAASSGNRNGISAVGAELAARRYSFADEFSRYGVWNTLPPGTYADRRLWPAPGLWASGTLSRKARDTKVLKVNLNHLALAPLVLRAGTGLPTRAKLRVIVDAPNKSRGSRASVQIRLRSGTVKTYFVKLNAAGNASRLYPFNTRYVKSAIVILSNGSIGYNAQPFKVRATVVY